MSRKTITANDVGALDVSEFSTVVKSTAGWPLVVERTMTWDRQQGYGAHTERAADAPSTTWYFAEGSPSQPVMVERAQYWPDPTPQWYEAHSASARCTRTRAARYGPQARAPARRLCREAPAQCRSLKGSCELPPYGYAASHGVASIHA